MLTFPPRTFEAGSTAFPVVFRGNGVAALSKPAGIPIDEHPWNGGARATLCGEFRRRIGQGSPAAEALGIARPAAALLTDADCSGLVLLADRENGILDAWRNAVGSGLLRFRFAFLAPAGASAPEFECRLPVAAHFSEPRAVVSSKTGRKSETRFRREEDFGKFALWAAETAFPRLHQVRLHAAESGIPVVGDALYGGAAPLVNASFCRKGRLNKGEERPIYAPICLHLERISVPAGTLPGVSEALEISAPLPSGFSALLKKLRSRSRLAS